MYTREQASQLRQEFWTTFGQYVSPLLSSEGLRINWLNYKTGIKYVYFRMDAEKKNAWIGIEIAHHDLEIQELFFQQFEEYKTILHETLNEEWDWELHTTDAGGKTVSRIKKTIAGVNVFKKEDWPALISFFKPRIIALDEFWINVKDGFESLK
jgi:hypothetical protein